MEARDITFHLARVARIAKDRIKRKKGDYLSLYGEKYLEKEAEIKKDLERISAKILKDYINENDLGTFFVLMEDEELIYGSEKLIPINNLAPSYTSEFLNKNLLIFDPIDGSNNYVKGIGDAAISIALAKGFDVDDLLGGVIARLRESESVFISVGSSNLKFYRNNLDEAIQFGYRKNVEEVREATAILDMHFLKKIGKGCNIINSVAGPRYTGCISNAIIRLAEGSTDLILLEARPWDFAAALLYAINAGSYFAFINSMNGKEVFRNASTLILGGSNRKLVENAIDSFFKDYEKIYQNEHYMLVNTNLNF